MSENKCQFDIGEKVWILPFDDLYAQYGDGDGSMFGIARGRWEEIQSKGLHEISNVDGEDNTFRLKNMLFWWPSWALFPASPTVSVSIEDLL